MAYRTRPEADDDLRTNARWIALDHPAAAKCFLDQAFATFDLLAQFPSLGPRARLRARRLRGLRYIPVSPPFQNFLVFYQVKCAEVEIVRVLWCPMNWRNAPAEFF